MAEHCWVKALKRNLITRKGDIQLHFIGELGGAHFKMNWINKLNSNWLKNNVYLFAALPFVCWSLQHCRWNKATQKQFNDVSWLYCNSTESFAPDATGDKAWPTSGFTAYIEGSAKGKREISETLNMACKKSCLSINIKSAHELFCPFCRDVWSYILQIKCLM